MSKNKILEAERQLIYLLLNNKSLVSDWIDSDSEIKYFDVQHRPILTAILESYDKDVLLTRKSFQEFIKKLIIPIERVQQQVIFNDCLSSVVNENDFPLLLSTIMEGYLSKISLGAIRDFGKNREKKGELFAIKQLLGTFQDLETDASSGKKIIYQDIRDFSKERMKYIDDVRAGLVKDPPRLLCGIKEIDETMKIGFDVGTLTLFCGDVGGFKSCMMLNVALNIWQKGYNVLHVPVEMAEKRMYDRAWSRQARVDAEKIKDPFKLSKEERDRLEEAQKKWDDEKSKFFVMQKPDGTSVSAIKRQIEKYLPIFCPRLVVVDYIDNLDVDKDRQGRHDIEISDMLQELRRMGQELGFAVVSGAQLGRDALRRIRRAGASRDQNAFNSEDIRGAHTFSTDADNIYVQIANAQQPNSLLDIYVVKARDGKRLFPNGHLKATLLITPEIGLIRSMADLNVPGDNVLSQLSETDDDDEIDLLDALD